VFVEIHNDSFINEINYKFAKIQTGCYKSIKKMLHFK
jgi:hypothetical protein